MQFDPILPPGRVGPLIEAGFWSNRLITDVFDEVVNEIPENVAIVQHRAATGEKTSVTYAELASRSTRIAAGLAGLGVQPGDVVAAQLPNGWHYAALYIACARLGAVLNPLMPIFRHRELEFMLGFAEAKVLFIPQTFNGFDFVEMVHELRPKLPHLSHVFVTDGHDDATRFETQLLDRAWEDEIDTLALFAERRPDPNDVTELMYTSGTTGQPKGVMHTANTLLCKAKFARELFEWKPGESMHMGSPLAHQTGFMYACLLPIYCRGKAVLQDVWTAESGAKLIAEERCAFTMGSTPFLTDITSDEVRHHDLSSVRMFVCGGAPIPRALVERAAEVQPSMYVMAVWGMTENGIVTSTRPSDPLDKSMTTDGKALAGQAVRIVDDNGAEVPIGTEGRLEARCATNFVGYLKRPEAYGMTDDFWFDTGDNARMDPEGYIRITGRSKDIIIRGGENIPIVEVEELLYRHPAVQDAAVVAMPDPRLGERACAFVTLVPSATLEFDAMVTYLVEQKIAKNYLPERLEIIAEFERTPSGKIQKFKLREMAKSLSPNR